MVKIETLFDDTNIVNTRLFRLKSGTYMLIVNTKDKYYETDKIYKESGAGVIFYTLHNESYFGVFLHTPDMKYPQVDVLPGKYEYTLFVYESDLDGCEEIKVGGEQ